MFRLPSEEARLLRSHFVTSNIGRGGNRYLPFVFTEHGVAMLSSVLKSKHAVQMNILIIRAFVRLREMFSTNKAWAKRLVKLEVQQRRDLKRLPEPAQRPIGFKLDRR